MNKTLQQLLNESGFIQYINKEVVNSAPKLKLKKGAKIYFFKLDKYYTDDELKEEYEKRGLIPCDAYMLAKQAKDFISEKKYLFTHWKDQDNKWCFAAFGEWDGGGRRVSVDSYGSRWFDHWWASGVRKSFALGNKPSSETQSLDLESAIKICKENGLKVIKEM